MSDIKKDEGLDTMTAEPTPPAQPTAQPPVRDEKTASVLPPATAEPPAYSGNAIRGAYLARLAVEPEGVAGAEHETIAANAVVRGAYVAHLAAPESGSVGGEHTAGADLLRGIYAARVTAVTPLIAIGGRSRAKAKKSAAQRKGRVIKHGAKARKATAPQRAAMKKARGTAKPVRRPGTTAAGNRGRRR